MADMSRPGLEILRMKQAVAAAQGQAMDSDTAEFMRALGVVMDWLDHLEPEYRSQPRLTLTLLVDGRRVSREIGPLVLDALKPEGWGAVAAARVQDMVREFKA